ncbi:MAG: hypothetical protein R2909_02815 [Gemmatimonadales bacterium]
MARLTATLRALGYQFRDTAAALPGPLQGDIEAGLAELERLVGKIPATLADFYRVIGSIDLRGSHAEWAGCAYPDPLVVEPLEAVLAEARDYAALEDPAAEYWASGTGRFRAPVAPDALHKAGQSGGMWYSVEIPGNVADPVVLEEPHGLPFSEYVGLALAWGGFPGLERCRDHTWPLAQLLEAARAG